MRTVRAAVLVFLCGTPAAAQSIDDLIGLARARGTPAIRSDGQWVAFGVRETNWTDNAYETEIWLADARGGGARQLTSAKGSSSQPSWSPDGTWLAFLSDRTGTQQIYRLSVGGGEG
jgi:Tol biopolymer transport system component